MLFLIHCTDRADGAPIRAAAYDDHRAWLRASPVDIRLAGPILADDGETRVGSVFVVEVPDRAAAESFSAGDPFTRAGLFERVIVSRFLDITRGKPAFGATTP